MCVLDIFVDNLFGQRQMVFAAGRIGIIEDNGQTMAGTFAELDVTLNNSFEYEFLEVTFHFVVDLVGQT